MNTRQVQMLMIDVYALLAEVLGDTSGVIIDGGAHSGETTERLTRLFPNATVHAFEPVGVSYESLMRRCEAIGPRAVAHRNALGEVPATADIHVNKNLWTCSLLAANSRGHEFHGDWCESVRSETVSVIRLDDWADDLGIGDVSLLKLDLQGYELAALRGAAGLLQRTAAVYSEAQISPEYTGAATFAEIDLFLRESGFSLYQISDLCLKGSHCEPSCCDGLWLRRDLHERVLASAAPLAIKRVHDRRSIQMAAGLDLCARRGARRVMVYGAGAHTRACGAAIAGAAAEIVGVIDDRAEGTKLWGYPIVKLPAAIDMRPDAVVLSSDAAEGVLLGRSSELLDAGIPVVSLYTEDEPCWHEPSAP